MTGDRNDPILDRLRALAVLEPDPSKREHVRMRCRAALTNRTRAASSAPPSGRSSAGLVESRLIYALSVVYLLAMILDLIRLYMWL